ncbi:Peptidase S10 serine carboxypeptidase protein [Dioscorea alata]|uniref:Peptidase S10 serine carboxypeptidase protein n=1 Tax=Dioscorea alata TaxID=55571 RepID=A0ACB7TTI9_DIOAL|nr:Peptidase S10 serine carboxypeptidase protein [Dioscorea alata]
MASTILLLLLLLLISISISTSKASSSTFPPEALPTKSGYLSINSTSNSSFFYTFYEAQHPSTSTPTPLLIHLQGGPGCSSMFANFFELGPFLISPTSPTLHPNPFSWNRVFSLLFIDNPIVTGFSIAASFSDIPKDQPTVAAHLYTALQLFFSQNPPLRSRPLFLTGESYAGKYIPSFAYHILQRNSVTTQADTAYFTGFINAKQRQHMESLQRKTVEFVKEGQWLEATKARIRVLDYLQNVTGLATLYDYSKKKSYQSEMVTVLLNKEEVKECSEVVGSALEEDVMKSVKEMVEEVVKKSRVLLYYGMNDLRGGVVAGEEWVKEMEWEGLEEFLNVERKVWEVDGEVAGYVQRWGSLSLVGVAGAGHMVPMDKGRNAQAMIEDWVLENGLFGRDDELKIYLLKGKNNNYKEKKKHKRNLSNTK